MPDSEPPSAMIRVPTPLIDAVRKLSRLHRQGRTRAVIEGIERLVAAIDSGTDIDIDSVSESLSRLSERLDRLEAGLDDSKNAFAIASAIQQISKRLGKLESDVGAIALTIQELSARVFDFEGVGDITTAVTPLSELPPADDISQDIEVTAGRPDRNDINTDVNLIAGTPDRSDISDDSGTTAEVGEQADINADSESITEPAEPDAITTDSESTAEAEEPADIATDSESFCSSESPSRLMVPFSKSALAKRFGISDKAIQKHREKGKESFAEWSRERDPDDIAWTWEGRGGRGQALRFVPVD